MYENRPQTRCEAPAAAGWTPGGSSNRETKSQLPLDNSRHHRQLRGGPTQAERGLCKNATQNKWYNLAKRALNYLLDNHRLCSCINRYPEIQQVSFKRKLLIIALNPNTAADMCLGLLGSSIKLTLSTSQR